MRADSRAKQVTTNPGVEMSPLDKAVETAAVQAINPILKSYDQRMNNAQEAHEELKKRHNAIAESSVVISVMMWVFGLAVVALGITVIAWYNWYDFEFMKERGNDNYSELYDHDTSILILEAKVQGLEEKTEREFKLWRSGDNNQFSFNVNFGKRVAALEEQLYHLKVEAQTRPQKTLGSIQALTESVLSIKGELAKLQEQVNIPHEHAPAAPLPPEDAPQPVDGPTYRLYIEPANVPNPQPEATPAPEPEPAEDEPAA